MDSRQLIKYSNEKILDYIKTNQIAKLHLGCGNSIVNGWLNTDIRITEDRLKNGVVFLDASLPFNIPDNSFDYIFSEHMFEHLTYKGGKNMIKECYRILKPGGVIRISTPDLEFLIDLYLHPEKEINKAYIEFDAKRTKQPEDPIYAINHFHTDWGHKIVYDQKSLTNLLSQSGFKNIYRCEVGKSEYYYLNNLENHHKHFEELGCSYDFNKLQSMVIEAQK